MVLTENDVLVLHNWEKMRQIGYIKRWLEQQTVRREVQEENRVFKFYDRWNKDVQEKHNLKDAVKDFLHLVGEDNKFLDDWEELCKFQHHIIHAAAAIEGRAAVMLLEDAKKHNLPLKMVRDEQIPLNNQLERVREDMRIDSLMSNTTGHMIAEARRQIQEIK
ncbi:MAG: hypothetical protein V1735_02335 [Nanoarchaeota archaeon]